MDRHEDRLGIFSDFGGVRERRDVRVRVLLFSAAAAAVWLALAGCPEPCDDDATSDDDGGDDDGGDDDTGGTGDCQCRAERAATADSTTVPLLVLAAFAFGRRRRRRG